MRHIFNKISKRTLEDITVHFSLVVNAVITGLLLISTLHESLRSIIQMWFLKDILMTTWNNSVRDRILCQSDFIQNLV